MAVCLSTAFMLISFLRTFGDMGSMKFGTAVMSAAMETPIWGTALGASIAFFIFAQILVHTSFACACWLLARASQTAWPSAQASRRQWTMLWLLAFLSAAIAVNAAWYPATSLGQPYAELANRRLGGIPSYLFVCSFVVLGALITLFLYFKRSINRISLPASVTAITVTFICTAFAFAEPESHSQTRPRGKPNVILIGIDSFRSDMVEDRHARERTPNIATYVSQSIRFTDATTPLARTFPSWVSILSGRHPHSSGAFVNLLPRELIETGDTLPQALGQHGYRTYYAIDETRFSNVDESFGFDKIVTPPFGASDFLLGTINDSPLSNLIVNTRLGKWLFPNSYGNRAAAMLYEPDEFISRVGRETTFDGPTFLAIHLTLLHWPYTWAGIVDDDDQNEGTADMLAHAAVAKYDSAAHRVDQQFGLLLETLERKGALENAIVVVLSDHGEALGDVGEYTFPYERFGQVPETVQLYGHGTSVFSPHQFKVLLAVRGYGAAAKMLKGAGTRDQPASVEDIYPTIMDVLGYQSTQPFDGLSLASLLTKDSKSADPEIPNRIRFTESEFNPRGIGAGLGLTTSALLLARRNYDVQPETGRLQVRRASISTMLKSRQYAAFRNQSFIAAVPDDFSSGFLYFATSSANEPPMPVSSVEEIKDRPDLLELWNALQARYALMPKRPEQQPTS